MSKVGVWFIGARGSVATTATVGAAAVRSGVMSPQGCVTESPGFPGQLVPLADLVFGGPGSASRATIGIVVVFGVAFSTLLSLFVVPAFYALLAKYTHSPEALAHELDKLESSTPEAGGHA